MKGKRKLKRKRTKYEEKVNILKRRNKIRKTDTGKNNRRIIYKTEKRNV